jgi:hypothetical protein
MGPSGLMRHDVGHELNQLLSKEVMEKRDYNPSYLANLNGPTGLSHNPLLYHQTP